MPINPIKLAVLGNPSIDPPVLLDGKTLLVAVVTTGLRRVTGGMVNKSVSLSLRSIGWRILRRSSVVSRGMRSGVRARASVSGGNKLGRARGTWVGLILGAIRLSRRTDAMRAGKFLAATHSRRGRSTGHSSTERIVNVAGAGNTSLRGSGWERPAARLLGMGSIHVRLVGTRRVGGRALAARPGGRSFVGRSGRMRGGTIMSRGGRVFYVVVRSGGRSG